MSQSLLKLQIGPVQDFIAQARSTRDLWSGSYLLSWLMAAGISKLIRSLPSRTDLASAWAPGVVYPDLRGQPLVERRLAVDRGQEFTASEDNDSILTPNLPNLLVAVLDMQPPDAAVVARAVADAIHREWRDQIAEACWRKALAAEVLVPEDRLRFVAQVARFLSLAWQVTPLDAAAYAQAYQHNAWQLDAVRQTREFPAWRAGGWETGARQNKDTLSGREEAMLGGSQWWETERPRMNRLWPVLLRRRHEGDRLGAITLIKRIWHWAYLNDSKWGLRPLHVSEASPRPTGFPFPSTFHIAQHDPTKAELDDERETQEDAERLSRYYAVLAFDGDQIGQWVGGRFRQLDQAYHRDFSGRLGNFALRCVRPIVVACDGRLIYAGGDDVLALVPADTVLSCARFLRQAYCGQPAFITPLTALAKELLDAHQQAGRVAPRGHAEEVTRLHQALAVGAVFRELNGRVALAGEAAALDLPGEVQGSNEEDESVHPDASVGIALAHFKNPLQDVIREAQAAEKRAKRSPARAGLDRSAVAIALLKRSGEQVEWGCKWNSGGLEVYDAVQAAIREGAVSARFPHRVCELVEGYLTEAGPLASGGLNPLPDFPVIEVLLREVQHVLGRQGAATTSGHYLRLQSLISDDDPANRVLETYLRGERRRAEAALAKVKQNAAHWSRLDEGRRRQLERAPWESPIRALLGLMKTAAFTRTSASDRRAEPSRP